MVEILASRRRVATHIPELRTCSGPLCPTRRTNRTPRPQVEGEGKEKEKKKEAADAKKIFSLVYDEVEDGPVTRIGIDGADAWCMRAPAELPPCSISPALNSVTLSW